MEYLCVSSKQDLDLFPQNVWHDFCIVLPTELYNKDGWECALLSFDINPLTDLEVNVFCDLVKGSCFQKSLLPFLSKVSRVPIYFENLNFVKVISPSVKSFRIYIKTAFSQELPSDGIEEITLILVLRPYKHVD